MKESFVFFETWADAIRHMPDKERLQVYDAIMAYGIYGEKTEIGGLAQMALNLVYNDIDNCKTKRKEKAEKARESANKRWQNQNANQCKRMQTDANACERMQSDATRCYNVNVNGNVNVNDNVNVNGVKENADKSATREIELFDVEQIKKEKKSKFGEYKNVLLTKEEFETLNSKYGQETAGIIDNYSQYKEMKGYKCKRDYLAIIKWGVNAYRETQHKLPRHIDTSERDNRNIEEIWK